MAEVQKKAKNKGIATGGEGKQRRESKMAKIDEGETAKTVVGVGKIEEGRWRKREMVVDLSGFCPQGVKNDA